MAAVNSVHFAEGDVGRKVLKLGELGGSPLFGFGGLHGLTVAAWVDGGGEGGYGHVAGSAGATGA